MNLGLIEDMVPGPQKRFCGDQDSRGGSEPWFLPWRQSDEDKATETGSLVYEEFMQEGLFSCQSGSIAEAHASTETTVGMGFENRYGEECGFGCPSNGDTEEEEEEDYDDEE